MIATLILLGLWIGFVVAFWGPIGQLLLIAGLILLFVFFTVWLNDITGREDMFIWSVLIGGSGLAALGAWARTKQN